MIPIKSPRAARVRAGLLCVSALLAGCTTIPATRGFPEVAALVAARGPDAPPVPADDRPVLADWLAAPLTVESAVRIALVRSPRLREQYAALGIAQADLYDAARLANPLFSLEWLDSTAGGARMTLGLAQNFADLLNLSPRRRLATQGVRQAQLTGAAAIVRFASDVEAAYYRHLGAVTVATLRATIARAAATSRDLATRYRAAGNLSPQALLDEEIAATQAQLAADRAQLDVTATRAALDTLLGLDPAETRWTLAASLPLPVAEEESLAELQQLAAAGRLDLLAAREAVAQAESAAGSVRRRRLLGALQVGVQREREPDGSHALGPTLGAELPLFNWGRGKVLRAQAALEQRQAALATLQVGLANALAAGHAKVATARALVDRYRHELLPRQEQRVARVRERQQFMLIGPFELLQARQQEFDAYQGYLEALTDYAVARAELGGITGTRLPRDAAFGAERLPSLPAAAPPAAPGTAPSAHHHHEETP